MLTYVKFIKFCFKSQIIGVFYRNNLQNGGGEGGLKIFNLPPNAK